MMSKKQLLENKLRKMVREVLNENITIQSKEVDDLQIKKTPTGSVVISQDSPDGGQSIEIGYDIIKKVILALSKF